MNGYAPHKGQKAFHLSQVRFRNICAGRQGGKTLAAAIEFLARIVGDQRKPAFALRGVRQYWALSPTKELNQILLKNLKIAAAIYKIPLVTTSKKILIPGWPIEIYLRTTGSVAQLIGEQVYGLWLDETAKMTDEAWGYLKPVLSATAGWCITSTTPEGMNWYYEEFWRKGDPTDPDYDPRYSNHHFVSADNPFLAHICPTCLESYISNSPGWLAGVCPADGTELIHESIWDKDRMVPRIYKREHEASFDSFMGQIWENLDKDTHWGWAPRNMRRLLAGQDWNYALPGVYLLLSQGYDSEWWILDEIHQDRLPVYDDKSTCWVSQIKEMNKGWAISAGAKTGVIWADPSSPDSIEIERRKGLPVRPAKNSVKEGLQTVETLFHPLPVQGPRLKFALAPNGHPRARKTWKQCVSYQYIKGTEKPLKKDDHSCDALRYPIYSTIGKTRNVHTGSIVGAA